MRLVSNIIILLLFALCLSCNDDFSYDSDSEQRRIVVEGVADSEEGIKMRLSASNEIFTDDTSRTYVTKASIRLYVNTNLVDFMREESPGVYASNIIPKSGDTVRFVGRQNEYPIIICEDVMPTPISVLLFDTAGRIGNNFDLLLRFVEKTNETNGYYMSVRSMVYEYDFNTQGDIIDSVRTTVPINLSSANKLFFSERNLVSNQNDYNIFNDQLIPGGTYDLSLIVNAKDLDETREQSASQAILLDFKSLAPSSYETLEGVQLNSRVFGGPFSTTNNVSDNIEGGYGIMQYSWSFKDTIWLP